MKPDMGDENILSLLKKTDHKHHPHQRSLWKFKVALISIISIIICCSLFYYFYFYFADYNANKIHDIIATLHTSELRPALSSGDPFGGLKILGVMEGLRNEEDICRASNKDKKKLIEEFGKLANLELYDNLLKEVLSPEECNELYSIRESEGYVIQDGKVLFKQDLKL